MKSLVAAACMLAASSASARAFETGETLYALLTGNELDRVVAMSYVAGVHDAYANITICAPLGTTKGQLAIMVRDWLYANPVPRRHAARALINEALSNAWPCKNELKDPGLGT